MTQTIQTVLAHASGRALPGQRPVCGLGLLALSIGGGALLLAAIAVFLALEP